MKNRIKSQRGFTIVEMIVSIAISSLIMVSLSSLMFIAGRSTRNLYFEAAYRNHRLQAFDQVRFRLVDGTIGSAKFQDGNNELGYRTLEFLNPMYLGQVSSFHFQEEDQTLRFRLTGAGNDPNGIIIGRELDDVRFRDASPDGATIQVTITTSHNHGGEAEMSERSQLYYLRNN